MERENRIRVLSGEFERSQELLEALAYPYVVVFGNVEPLSEGGINDEGTTIPLREYLGYVSGYEPSGSLEQMVWLKWIHELPDEERERILMGIKEKTGYRPYYGIAGVIQRFAQDLSNEDGVVPVVTYWKDEGVIKGFGICEVVNNERGLSRLVDNMPYLAGLWRMADAQDSEFVRVNRLISDLLEEYGINSSIFLESEGAMISETRSGASTVNWYEIVYAARLKAVELGVEVSLGITFPESRYYLNGKKHGEFMIDQVIVNNQGTKLVLVVVDLKKSVAQLETKLFGDNERRNSNQPLR